MQDLRPVHNADAVWQNKIRAVHRGVCRSVRAAGLHDLGIGCDNVVRAGRAEELFPARKRFFHRHIIKANA